MKGMNNAKEFIKTWQESSSTNEAAKKMNCTVNAITTRVCYFRSRGVNLKQFRKSPAEHSISRGYNSFNWQELIEYAESLKGKK